MTINLCKVDNISREDTPRFSTLSQQNTYFDNKTVSSIQTSFYPPHYTNEIKVSSEEYSFTAGINYLFFEYKGKRYYYFVDNVEYVNEDVVVLYIMLDSVQTYLFNMTIDGELERESLPRYIDNKINRDYIRENISDGDFRLKRTSFLSGQAWSNVTKSNNIYGWIVIKCSDLLSPDLGSIGHFGHAVGFQYDVPNTHVHKIVNTSYFYYFIPVVDATSTSWRITGIIAGGVAVTTYSGNIAKTLADLAVLPRVIGIYFVPGQIFKDNLFTITHGNDTVVCTPGHGEEVFRVGEKFGLTAADDSVVYPLGNLEFDTNVINLDTASSTWNKYIEPAMLDENYVRVSFGEQSADTTYPLFQCTVDNVKCQYWADLVDGFRFYQILGDTEYANMPAHDETYPVSLFPDPYRVTTSASTKLSYDLRTDPWVQWNEYNKASIAMAFVGLATSAITKGAVAQNRISNNNQDLADIAANPRSYDNRYKTLPQTMRPYKTAVQRRANALERDTGNVRAQQYANVAASSGSLLSTATSYYNSWFAPDSPREYGSIAADSMSNAYTQVVSVYEVKDYYRCALYYHMNGYLVSKLFHGVSFNDLIHREYFNVVKFKTINIRFNGCTNDTATLEELKIRYTNGVRFWEYNSNNGDTKCPIGYYNFANW